MKSEPRKLKSVKITIWLYFCLLAALMSILLIGIFCLVVVATFSDQAKNSVERVGGEVASAIKADPDGWENGFGDFDNRGINVFVYSESGQVLFNLGTDCGASQELFDGAAERLGSTSDGASAVYRDSGNAVYAEKVSYGGVEYVVASYSLEIIGKTVQRLQIYFLLTSLTVLLLALIISYSMSQKLTRGLNTMSETAVRMAKGDYGVKFLNADYREMAELSDSLNYVRDEVKKSQDFQREILANVSHDLKTPLTMIKAYASMVKEISGDNPEKRNKHLQVIIDEADRLTGLVNDVLSVSKINSNIDEINAKVFNLSDLLYGIINKFEYLQESGGYQLLVDIDADLYTRADEEKIGQVIYNLLGNAANYTGEDKKIYISLKLNMDGTRIKFTVRDTGKGISKEDLPEIWNRYYRVKEAHLRPVKGTGLGLNIIKVILENHSFDFGVDSKLGEGSTFWVDFPAVPSEI